MYLFLQQYDKAEECYRRLLRLDTPLVRSWGRYSLAIIPAYRGRFQEALEILDAGISADKMENMEGFPVLAKRALKAEIHVERGETDLALGQAEARPQDAERLLPETQLALRSLRAEILAKAGRFKEAEDAVRALKNETSQQGPVSLRTYWSQMGEMELARGNARVAIEWLEKAARERFSPEFSRRMTLAEAYLMAGRLDAAVGELEAALRRYDDQRAEAPVQAVKAYHLLGLAYEASGWTDRAAEQYEEFLKIWKDADPGIPCVEDARQRLARLKEL
jgi:tetratricopeptide (TPR) repeat protein